MRRFDSSLSSVFFFFPSLPKMMMAMMTESLWVELRVFLLSLFC